MYECGLEIITEYSRRIGTCEIGVLLIKTDTINGNNLVDEWEVGYDDEHENVY